jgi:4-hydroxybenzoate polyprenyltransferase
VPALLVVLANLIHPVSMNALNVAVDTRTDARNPHKRDLAAAAAILGTARIATLAFVEMALCLTLCAVAAIMLGRPIVFALMCAIIAFHLVYNLKPIHLKRRGFANPLSLGISFGFLPCVLSHAAVSPRFAAADWLIYSGLGLSVTARALWWMLPDREADAASGTITVAVGYGVQWMAAVSCAVALTVPLFLGWGLWEAYGPGWAAFGAVLGCTWFAAQLASLGTITSVSYSDLRKRSMTPMMVANVLFAVIPLTAG